MFNKDEFIYLAPEQSVLDRAEGSFARKILVLAQAEPEFAGNRDFLEKVLSAVQINLERDTLLAIAESGTPLRLMPELRKNQTEFVLVFGLPPAPLGLNIEAPLYRAVFFYGIHWLFADKLSALEPDRAKKGLLWTALKQLFLK
jgi:hypothetical protein